MVISQSPITDNGAVVVNTSGRPNAAHRPVPLGAVRFTDEFLAPRLRINHDVTIPSQFAHLEDTNRLRNFQRAAGDVEAPFEGIYFNDSDVYKWMEAAAWSLATEPDAALQAMLDDALQEVKDAQDSDGYLNTYFTFERAAERYSNLRDMHELYCAGHLLQAAVAHHRATGSSAFLQVAIRLADHLWDTFGPGKQPGAPGHEEVEMALVELFRDTGDDRYLRLADSFLSNRGLKPPLVGGSPYHQDHLPFRELNHVTGHAVRALYLTCGAADVVAETGEAALLNALEAQWSNFHAKRQYVTGGAGARYEGEAFGDDYELPNDRAYAETCAAIASVMWNWRMLALDGDARFADDLETALYNGVLSGLSLDGQAYFYQNPLADRGHHRRQPWFGCACCPPNIARLLASLPGYLASTSEDGVWIHLYAANESRVSLSDGNSATVTVQTEYPWDGEVTLTLAPEQPAPFVLHLRIPAWCADASVRVNGEPVEAHPTPGDYFPLRRTWKTGDTVTLTLPMPVTLLAAHPHTANTGRVTLRRGPLVYCIEAADHPGVDVWDLQLPASAEWATEARPDLLGGVTVLKTTGILCDLQGWDDALYRPAHTPPAQTRETPLTAIPYYAWANRDPGPMQVWIPLA